MKKKTVAIIGSVSIVILLAGILTVVMMGGGEPSFKEDLPTMDEVPTETYHFEPTAEVMIPDMETVFWPIFGPMNSTEVILVTGVQVHITWADDESPPPSRPFYQNLPDTMELEVTGTPYLQTVDSDGNETGNNTISMTSRSEQGSTRVDFDLKATPILLEEGADTNLSFDPAGTTESGNTGLFIGISCIAGQIESSRPALLRYTDRGDEVSMTVSITVKKVPVEVFDAWVADQTKSTEW